MAFTDDAEQCAGPQARVRRGIEDHAVGEAKTGGHDHESRPDDGRMATARWQFTGLPFFAPEIRSVEVADPLRGKQLKAGLTQLGEEGAIQVFRPIAGSVLDAGSRGPVAV